MRLLYVFVICVFASVNVLAADLLPLDKDGFGGIKWGTEFSSADKLGMKECLDIGSHIICEKKDESLKEIVGVPVEVYYVFTGAYFQYLTIKFDGVFRWPVITNALTKVYGKSEYDFNEFANEFVYEKTLGAAYIRGQYDGYKQVLHVSMKNIQSIDFEESAINRFDKMALSAFTGAERKSLEGLLGAKWGMTVEQIPNKLRFLRASGDRKVYIQSENLYFGYIPMSSIEYEFIDDKLMSITMYTCTRYDFLQETPYPDFAAFFKNIFELNFGKMDARSAYFLSRPKTMILIHNIGAHDNSAIIHATDPKDSK